MNNSASDRQDIAITITHHYRPRLEFSIVSTGGLTWYSNCGHREKRGRINQLLEVTDEKREEEVHP